MTSTFARISLAAALLLSAAALAQTDSAASPLPPAPSASTPAITNPGGVKVGTINLEQAIFATNEGQRDFDALSKKLEPKQNELKGKNDELEGLKKQLNTQGDKLNDQARSTLVKQIEQKQKSLDRDVQDARDDAQSQQNEIAQRILQKLGPMLVKYASDNKFGVILDTSNPWPNGPVIWADPSSVDITKTIVDAYNAQSGVAPPPRPAAAAKPPATTPARPAGQTTTPSTK